MKRTLSHITAYVLFFLALTPPLFATTKIDKEEIYTFAKKDSKYVPLESYVYTEEDSRVDTREDQQVRPEDEGEDGTESVTVQEFSR